MRFEATGLEGAYLVHSKRHEDDRGSFARIWCKREFGEQGLVADIRQVSMSTNSRKGTLRGLHLQAPPAAETRVVQCVRGAVYDVIVDLRRKSPSYLKWYAVELTADSHAMLYVPEGFAHGFQSLTDNAWILYLMSEFFSPEHVRGFRYDDPAFGIDWPLPVAMIAERDRKWPDYSPARA